MNVVNKQFVKAAIKIETKFVFIQHYSFIYIKHRGQAAKQQYILRSKDISKAKVSFVKQHITRRSSNPGAVKGQGGFAAELEVNFHPQF